MFTHESVKPARRQVKRPTEKVGIKRNTEVSPELPPRKLFFLLAETFQALGDSSRIQIVWALYQKEMSVGAIAKLLGMNQPAVSHHLRTLRNLKLVKVRRDGRTAFYSLDDEHIGHLLLEGIEHVEDLMK